MNSTELCLRSQIFPLVVYPLHEKNVLIFLEFSFYKMNIRALLAGFPIYCDKFSNVSNQLMRCFRHEKEKVLSEYTLN